MLEWGWGTAIVAFHTNAADVPQSLEQFKIFQCLKGLGKKAGAIRMETLSGDTGFWLPFKLCLAKCNPETRLT